MIKNSFSFVGVVVSAFNNKDYEFEKKLNVFEIELEKDDYTTTVIPVFYGLFTKGNIVKGDRVVVDGFIDVIEGKVCCVARSITNCLRWKKKKK